MQLLLFFTVVAALFASNNVYSMETLECDDESVKTTDIPKVTQATQNTQPAEAVTSGGCSSCAAIAEETELASKLSNV